MNKSKFTYRELFSLVNYSYGTSTPKPSIQASTSYYSSFNDGLKVITRQMVETYRKIYEENKDNKLQNNTTIHFSSLSNLPQYKYKNYIEENKLDIKKVRSNKSFDSLIVSHNFIIESYTRGLFKKYYIIPYNIIKPYLHKNSNEKSADFYLVNSLEVEKVQPINPNLYSLLINCEYVEGELITSGWGDTRKCKSFDDFTNIINDYDPHKFNIIFDESINNDINKGLVIDDDVFTSLSTMMSSSDKSNYSVAQEMIANCELEPSKPYILFLMWQYHFLKKINNNKNYEFCLKALSKYRSAYSSHTIEKFISDTLAISPEFKQQLFNCFRLYLNNKTGRDIIKEINVL
jgi:hypothetical protein